GGGGRAGMRGEEKVGGDADGARLVGEVLVREVARGARAIQLAPSGRDDGGVAAGNGGRGRPCVDVEQPAARVVRGGRIAARAGDDLHVDAVTVARHRNARA